MVAYTVRSHRVFMAYEIGVPTRSIAYNKRMISVRLRTVAYGCAITAKKNAKSRVVAAYVALAAI